jgi:DNA repair protein RadC
MAHDKNWSLIFTRKKLAKRRGKGMSKIRDDFNKAAGVENPHRENPMLAQRKITSSQDAYNILMESWCITDLELTEQFKIILLNHNDHCMAISTVATNGLAGCVVDIRLVFVTALSAKAQGIIIAHNHPPGQKGFSEADIKLTTRLVQIGHLLELPVLDHLIITAEGFTSFKDEGFMHTIRPHI